MHKNEEENILPSPLNFRLWAAVRDTEELRGLIMHIYALQCQLWFCGTFWKTLKHYHQMSFNTTGLSASNSLLCVCCMLSAGLSFEGRWWRGKWCYSLNATRRDTVTEELVPLRSSKLSMYCPESVSASGGRTMESLLLLIRSMKKHRFYQNHTRRGNPPTHTKWCWLT